MLIQGRSLGWKPHAGTHTHSTAADMMRAAFLLLMLFPGELHASSRWTSGPDFTKAFGRMFKWNVSALLDAVWGVQACLSASLRRLHLGGGVVWGGGASGALTRFHPKMITFACKLKDMMDQKLLLRVSVTTLNGPESSIITLSATAEQKIYIHSTFEKVLESRVKMSRVF